MRILLIDDLRNFKETVLPENVSLAVARNSEDAIHMLDENFIWDQIWFDHDLGMATGRIDTIMPVIDWLGLLAHSHQLVLAKEAIVHSSNPVGVKRMLLSLRNYGYATRQVYAPDYFTV